MQSTSTKTCQMKRKVLFGGRCAWPKKTVESTSRKRFDLADIGGFDRRTL